MKGVIIVYASALETQLMLALTKCGLKKYTKFPYLHGVGGHSEPHLDTQVWPGSNMGLLIALEEKMLPSLLKEVKELKQQFSDEGIKAFSFPLEELA
jgi:hypothetical protein